MFGSLRRRRGRGADRTDPRRHWPSQFVWGSRAAVLEERPGRRRSFARAAPSTSQPHRYGVRAGHRGACGRSLPSRTGPRAEDVGRGFSCGAASA